MQDAETPGISTGIARRPYARSMVVFRDAVYADPDLVSLVIPGEYEGELPVLWLTDMKPGDMIRVIGRHENHTWRAVLSCEAGGKFTVKPAGPDRGGQGG